MSKLKPEANLSPAFNMDIFFTIYLIIISISIIIGLVRLKKLDTPGKVLLLILIITIISESIAEFYMSKYLKNNYPVYHIFNPVELFLFSTIYYSEIKNNQPKFYIKLVMIIAPLFAIFNALFLQSVWEYNSNFLLLEFSAFISFFYQGMVKLFFLFSLLLLFTHK